MFTGMKYPHVECKNNQFPKLRIFKRHGTTVKSLTYLDSLWFSVLPAWNIINDNLCSTAGFCFNVQSRTAWVTLNIQIRTAWVNLNLPSYTAWVEHKINVRGAARLHT